MQTDIIIYLFSKEAGTRYRAYSYLSGKPFTEFIIILDTKL